jgi:LysM repeat protein
LRLLLNSVLTPFLLLLFLLFFSASANARVVVYVARPGDTPESVAADYYGNRSLALFISEGNGIKDGKLRPGQRVRIPTAFKYRLRKGDTLEALAQRFLDDKRRATFLAQTNGLKLSDKLREGQELLIPFQHMHTANAPESLQSVARAFYGDPARAKMLADFNFRSAPMLAKGEKLLVPIAHVRIRAVRLAPPLPQRPGVKVTMPEPPTVVAAANPEEAKRQEDALAARVKTQLQAAERAYTDGDYQDVPAQLDKLLAAEEPSEAQLAEIFRLKAYAYVALGMEELAHSAFREVLERKPDLKLDEATVSPKIRAALERARKAPEQ